MGITIPLLCKNSLNIIIIFMIIIIIMRKLPSVFPLSSRSALALKTSILNITTLGVMVDILFPKQYLYTPATSAENVFRPFDSLSAEYITLPSGAVIYNMKYSRTYNAKCELQNAKCKMRIARSSMYKNATLISNLSKSAQTWQFSLFLD